MAIRRRATRRTSDIQGEEKKRKESWALSWLDEAVALFCFAAALFLLVSFLSYILAQGGRPVSSDALLLGSRHNLVGPAGHLAATLLVGLFGWCTLAPVLCLIWFAVFLWRYDTSSLSVERWFTVRAPLGLAGVLVSACTLAVVYFGARAGGSVGQALAVPLIKFFDTAGATIIAGAVLLLSLALWTALSVVEILKKGFHIFKGAVRALLRMLFFALRLMGTVLSWVLSPFGALLGYFGLIREGKAAVEPASLPRPRVRKNHLAEEEAGPSKETAGDQMLPGSRGEEYTHVVVSRYRPEELTRRRRSLHDWRLKTKAAKKAEGLAAEAFYKPPPFDLLTPAEPTVGGEDDKELLEKSRLIENKLGDFGVLGRVTEVHPGPVITLFEFEPAPGVKVGRVASLADDLAMSLRASSIRVIAPIPRRGTVGIELPNRHRDIVRLRDVLESDSFANADSILSACIGKDTYGQPVVIDINNMPHLLMAGATGTGKSVCINSILLSLLYRASPAELGFILIDPKILELSVYEGIPHLRVPVVTHARQARAVLKWAVDEMHRRYRIIQRFGVRNIDAYNRIVMGENEHELGSKPSLGEQVVMLQEEGSIGEEAAEKPATIDSQSADSMVERLEPLPKILIVIDEVADLMLSVGRDIEELITRLAQKSRAAGIHLLIATQRPSVDVVTGLIKANFPARISFRVSSRIDSRTILDSMGAEKLLGRGDMLFMQPGAEALKRVHGAYVSDSEVKKVVACVKEQGAPHYDEQIMRVCEKALEEDGAIGSEGGAGAEEEYDAIYDKAVELVVEKGYASTSMIQRVFRVGYNRAARIVELMEKEGIVGPMDGAKPREVLLPRSGLGEGAE